MKKPSSLLVTLAVIISLLAVCLFAGEVKASTTVHETVDIKIVSTENVYILVINPANGQEAGYTSPSTGVNTFNTGPVYATLVSPQEVQLTSQNGFEGDNAINFNIEIFDPAGTFTLTATHTNNNGYDSWGPKTWTGTISEGQSYIAVSGIDVNGYVKGDSTFFALPEYAVGALLALGSCFAAYLIFNKRKNLPVFKHN
jgi:hypothetical protein